MKSHKDDTQYNPHYPDMLTMDEYRLKLIAHSKMESILKMQELALLGYIRNCFLDGDALDTFKCSNELLCVPRSITAVYDLRPWTATFRRIFNAIPCWEMMELEELHKVFVIEMRNYFSANSNHTPSLLDT